MTTKTLEAERLNLPWDHFLVDPTEHARNVIDGWRRTEWDAVVRQLLQEFRWVIPSGMEPHWVGPGKAIYWQEQVKREKRFVDNQTGEEIPHVTANVERGHYEGVWVPTGWSPTGPLPANNASQLAHYLNKGLRLRPPVEGVDAEYQREAADLPEVSNEDPVAKYFCHRHEKGSLGFVTWKAYIRHCAASNEPPTETPPSEALERASHFRWYCHLHDVGFNQEKAVGRHYKTETRKPGGRLHPTVEEMRTDKEKRDA